MVTWTDIVQEARNGNEDAETLVASAYVYSKLSLPLDAAARRLHIEMMKSFFTGNLTVDEAFGRMVTEKVVNRFILGIGELGEKSPYARALYSSAMNHVSFAYPGKIRFQDEYFLVWDLAALYYHEGDLVCAGNLFADALILKDLFCNIAAISQVQSNDACDISDRDIAKSLYLRGKASEEGLHGLDVDYQDAQLYYTLSAKRGNAAAKFALGVMLYEGRPGVAKNLWQSRELIEDAAREGNQNAEDFLKTAEYPSGKPHVIINNTDNRRTITITGGQPFIYDSFNDPSTWGG